MKSAKWNFVLNTLNQVLGIIVPLITTPYLSRVIGPEKLGLFSYANSVTYYFTLLGILGLANYGGREIAKARGDRECLSRTFSGIYYAQLISSVTVCVAYFIYMLIEGSTITKVFFISVVSVVFDINWVFYGLEKFDVTLARNFFVKLISTVLIFIFVKKPNDIVIYALLIVSSSFLSNVFLWFAIRKRVRFVFVKKDEVMRHLKSNLSLFLPIVLISFYKVMDKIMLKWMANYIELGYYECADKIGQVPLYLISSLSQVMIPRISYNRANSISNDSYLKKSMVFISILSTTMIFGVVCVADIFVPLYFGKGYDACIDIIRIIVPSYIFTGYANVMRSQLLIPYDRDKEFAISLAVGAAINFVLNIYFIRIWGANGAAFATAITELTVLVVTYLYTRAQIKLTSLLKENFLYYLAGVVMILVLTFVGIAEVSVFNLFLKVIIGGVTYCFVLTIGYLFIKRKR